MDKVKHVTKPSEPFATANAVGRICKDPHSDRPRIAPAARGLPAMAFIAWNDGDFTTWEKLSDLIPMAEKPEKKSA